MLVEKHDARPFGNVLIKLKIIYKKKRIVLNNDNYA